MPVISEEIENNRLLEGGERATVSEPRRWHVLPATAAIAIVGVIAVAFLSQNTVVPHPTLVPAHSVNDEFSGLSDASAILSDEADPCKGLPHLKIKTTTHNNLGGKGPDAGDQTLVYDALSIDPESGDRTPVDLVFKVASGTYTPYGTMKNGMSGFYGFIVLDSGSDVTLDMNIIDKAGNPKVLKTAALTFFDLDEAPGHKSQESVTVSGMSDVTVTHHTEVAVKDHGSGKKSFTSSTAGDGADNPDNPMTLTHKQKNRAVSLEFKDVSTIPMRFDVSPGTGPRSFIFVGRPTLKCFPEEPPACGILTGFQTFCMWVSVLLGTLLGLMMSVMAGVGKLVPGAPMSEKMSVGFDKVFGPFFGLPGASLRMMIGLPEFIGGVCLVIGLWMDALKVYGTCHEGDWLRALIVCDVVSLAFILFSAMCVHGRIWGPTGAPTGPFIGMMIVLVLRLIVYTPWGWFTEATEWFTFWYLFFLPIPYFLCALMHWTSGAQMYTYEEDAKSFNEM